MIKTWGKSWHLWIAGIFSAWGLYLRYQRLAQRDLWIDETNQIKGTIGALKPFWQRVDYGELTCFPGEYLLTWPFVNAAPSNKWIVMIPHIAATVISFCLLYVICRRHFQNAFATAVAFAVFTFNSNLIFHAFELRPYSVLIMLGLAVFICAEMVISHAYQLNKVQKILIWILFFLTMQYHAYGIFIVFFSTIFWVLREFSIRPRMEVIRDIFQFYLLLLLIAFPVWLWYAAADTGFSYRQSVSRGIQTFEYLANPLTNPVGFFKNVFGNMIGYKMFYPLLAVAALALVISKQRGVLTGFLLVIVVVPMILIVTSDTLKGYWFLPRQFSWIMPLFAFFLGWCTDAVVLQVRQWRQSK